MSLHRPVSLDGNEKVEQAGLALGSTRGILVDDSLRTSDPNIYAAGDAVQIKDYQSG